MTKVHEIKAKLLELCDLLHEARAEGYVVQFNLATNEATGESHLAAFRVLQEVKVDN